jgi:hypothetical protein
MAAPDYRLKPYNRWYVYLLLIVLASAGLEAIKPVLKARFAEGYKNVTGSMRPTLVAGDNFLRPEAPAQDDKRGRPSPVVRPQDPASRIPDPHIPYPVFTLQSN